MKKKQLAIIICLILLLQSLALAAGELPDRTQIPTKYKWNLTDIYKDSAVWEKDCQSVQSMEKDYAQYQGKLGASADALYACLQLNDRIGEKLNKVYQYAKLKSDEDIADNNSIEMTGRATQLDSEVSSASSFITPEVSTIDSATIIKFIARKPELKIYSFYFNSIARQKPHILDQKSEKLMADLSETAGSPANVYNVLTGSDIKFPTIQDGDGQNIQLSPGRYSMLMQSLNREVRKNAFLQYNGAYRQYRNTLAQTLNDFVRTNIIDAKVRNYHSAIDAALQPNQIPVSVYDNLIATVNGNLKLLHSYMNLRKKVMRLDEMHAYDLYTPLVADADTKYSYDTARTIVQNALKPLGTDYQKLLSTAFNSRWIDVYETKNKRSGGYSWGPYGVHPYVLLNYNGKYDDVSTVAHELGHSMHSYYSYHSQPFCTAFYATFTAETASTVNEILLADYMLQNTSDVKVKTTILNEYLEQIRGTVFTQVMFAEFEKQIYAASEAGQILTADYLDVAYHKLLVKYYGPDVIIDKEADSGWSRIPHFYRYFYVYQYATGYSAATSFATSIESNPANAQQYISKFLKAGGSDSPVVILKNAGVDMNTPQPVDAVMTKFASALDGMYSTLKISPTK